MKRGGDNDGAITKKVGNREVKDYGGVKVDRGSPLDQMRANKRFDKAVQRSRTVPAPGEPDYKGQSQPGSKLIESMQRSGGHSEATIKEAAEKMKRGYKQGGKVSFPKNRMF